MRFIAKALRSFGAWLAGHAGEIFGVVCFAAFIAGVIWLATLPEPVRDHQQALDLKKIELEQLRTQVQIEAEKARLKALKGSQDAP